MEEWWRKQPNILLLCLLFVLLPKSYFVILVPSENDRLHGIFNNSLSDVRSSFQYRYCLMRKYDQNVPMWISCKNSL